MSPPAFHVTRAIIVALVGALSTVLVSQFDSWFGSNRDQPNYDLTDDDDAY